METHKHIVIFLLPQFLHVSEHVAYGYGKSAKLKDNHNFSTQVMWYWDEQYFQHRAIYCLLPMLLRCFFLWGRLNIFKR